MLDGSRSMLSTTQHFYDVTRQPVDNGLSSASLSINHANRRSIGGGSRSIIGGVPAVVHHVSPSTQKYFISERPPQQGSSYNGALTSNIRRRISSPSSVPEATAASSAATVVGASHSYFVGAPSGRIGNGQVQRLRSPGPLLGGLSSVPFHAVRQPTMSPQLGHFVQSSAALLAEAPRRDSTLDPQPPTGMISPLSPPPKVRPQQPQPATDTVSLSSLTVKQATHQSAASNLKSRLVRRILAPPPVTPVKAAHNDDIGPVAEVMPHGVESAPKIPQPIAERMPSRQPPPPPVAAEVAITDDAPIMNYDTSDTIADEFVHVAVDASAILAPEESCASVESYGDCPPAVAEPTPMVRDQTPSSGVMNNETNGSSSSRAASHSRPNHTNDGVECLNATFSRVFCDREEARRVTILSEELHELGQIAVLIEWRVFLAKVLLSERRTRMTIEAAERDIRKVTFDDSVTRLLAQDAVLTTIVGTSSADALQAGDRSARTIMRLGLVPLGALDARRRRWEARVVSETKRRTVNSPPTAASVLHPAASPSSLPWDSTEVTICSVSVPFVPLKVAPTVEETEPTSVMLLANVRRGQEWKGSSVQNRAASLHAAASSGVSQSSSDAVTLQPSTQIAKASSLNIAELLMQLPDTADDSAVVLLNSNRTVSKRTSGASMPVHANRGLDAVAARGLRVQIAPEQQPTVTPFVDMQFEPVPQMQSMSKRLGADDVVPKATRRSVSSKSMTATSVSPPRSNRATLEAEITTFHGIHVPAAEVIVPQSSGSKGFTPSRPSDLHETGAGGQPPRSAADISSVANLRSADATAISAATPQTPQRLQVRGEPSSVRSAPERSVEGAGDVSSSSIELWSVDEDEEDRTSDV